MSMDVTLMNEIKLSTYKGAIDPDKEYNVLFTKTYH